MSTARATITAGIIARDEERNLQELLPTLRWADELLVVVDAASQDSSAAAARLIADRVEINPFQSYAAQRNAALDFARGEWMFFVDADERVSSELAAEVRRAVDAASTRSRLSLADEAQEGPAGYWVPRQNVIFGHTMRGAGWFPDYQLRLLDRSRARYDEDRPVHEVVQLRGDADFLSTPLLHFNYQNLGQFIRKQRRYTGMEVQALLASGNVPKGRALVGQPAREFWRRYVELGGWRDGWVGLVLSAAMAFYSFERVRLARAGRQLAP